MQHDYKSGSLSVRTMRSSLLAAGMLLATSSVQAIQINILPGAGLSANPLALAAFERAADRWEAHIADPIEVFINADYLNLGSPTLLGQASSVLLQGSYSEVRDQLVADAADEADDAIVAALPASFAALNVNLPNTFTLSDALVGSKASLKAAGFAGLDTIFGSNDGTIEFNSGFAFDFDNSDGVGAGLFDFETVAAHEIGHTLGFLSMVDAIDSIQALGGMGTTGVGITTLDLFRFGMLEDPSSLTEFSNFARELSPGEDAFFDDLNNEYAMSTGVFSGDGRQASHWKDFLNIGMMDPTLAPGQVFDITAADLRALDLIGYEITAVPLPAAAWLFASGLLMLGGLSRRRSGHG